MAKLMSRLGYDQYIVQGGDWGSLIACNIAELDPIHCMGIHLNMAVPPLLKGLNGIKMKLEFLLFKNFLFTKQV